MNQPIRSLLLFFISLQALWAHKNFVLEKYKDVVIDPLSADIYPDSTGTTQISALMNFEPDVFVSGDVVNRKQKCTHYWMRFDLENFEQVDYIILAPTNNKQVDLYFFDPIRNKLITYQRGNISNQYFSKYLSQLGMASLSKQPVTYYVRFERKHSGFDDILVLSPVFNHLNVEFPTFLQRGMTMGFLIILFLINVLMLNILKETSFFYYTIWQLFLMLYFIFQLFSKILFVYTNQFFSLNTYLFDYFYHIIYGASGVLFVTIIASVSFQKQSFDTPFRYLVYTTLLLRLLYFLIGIVFPGSVVLDSWIELFFITPVVGYFIIKNSNRSEFRAELVFVALVWCAYVNKSLFDSSLLKDVNVYFSKASLVQLTFMVPCFVWLFYKWNKVTIITKEKEQALNNYMNQLEINQSLVQKINTDLGKQVVQRSQQLEDKNKQLDSFVFAISHYIRGPIATIKGLISIGKAHESEQIRTYFSLIEGASKNLESIFTDVNKILTIDKWPIRYEIINLEDLMQSIMQKFNNIHQTLTIDISIPKGVYLFSDKYVLQEIISVIVQNANDFADNSKPRSYLKIYFEETSNANVLYFADNGIGMHESVKKNIWTIYYRGSERSKGSGVGLYIANIACSKISARLEFESEDQKGTVFKLYIPKNQS